MTSGLLIAAPLRVEAALISSAARGARVRKTGMGTERAKAAADGLAGDGGDALLVLGFCGGLDEGSVPGEAIVAEEVYVAADENPGSERGPGPQRVVCANVASLADTLVRAGLRVRRGPIVCVSRPALGERRAELRAGGAIAVDMESVWLAAGAGQRPFSVVRVVLDSPTHELVRLGIAGQSIRAARALWRAAAALARPLPR